MLSWFKKNPQEEFDGARTPQSMTSPANIEHGNNLEAFMDDSEMPEKKKFKMTSGKLVGVAVGVCLGVAVVTLAVSLGKKGSSSSSTPSDGTLSNDPTTTYNGVWKCQDSPSSTTWGNNCNVSCAINPSRTVSCCSILSADGACDAADVSTCDPRQVPSTCQVGYEWFCASSSALQPGSSQIYTTSACQSLSTCNISQNVLCCASGVLCNPVNPTSIVDPANCASATLPKGCSAPAPTTAGSPDPIITFPPNVTSTDGPNTTTAAATTAAATTAPVTTAPATPKPTPAPTPKPTRAANGDGLTVYNNCDGLNIYIMVNAAAQPLPAECADGNVCSNFNGASQGFNIYAATSGWGSVGTTTLVELTPTAQNQWWYDISKIKGYNVGASISYNGGHTVVCNSLLCKDAYHLCETGKNDFNPVYNVPRGQAISVTFCPDASDSAPTMPDSGRQEIQPSGGVPYHCNA